MSSISFNEIKKISLLQYLRSKRITSSRAMLENIKYCTTGFPAEYSQIINPRRPQLLILIFETHSAPKCYKIKLRIQQEYAVTHIFLVSGRKDSIYKYGYL